MVSRDMASRENWSFLPLYLSWIFLSCGATSSMRRWLLICLTKIGMSAARTTMTRPTIDSTQVTPASGSMPMVVHSQWNATRISSMAHLMGHRSVPMRSKDQSFRDGMGEEVASTGAPSGAGVRRTGAGDDAGRAGAASSRRRCSLR